MTRSLWCALWHRDPPMLLGAEWQCLTCWRRWPVGLERGTFRPEVKIAKARKAEARKQRKAQQTPRLVTPIRSVGGRTI